MSNELDVFGFELNETLYFEKGQEVSEMIGISLDPEISIQSFEDYISIRGVIELNGEYEKDQTRNDIDSNIDSNIDFEDYQSKRYLERTEDGMDGVVKFSHRFPVEISVPQYRVSDMDNITVSIESFDYELSNQNQLRLNSNINIHGISNHDQDSDFYDHKEKNIEGRDFIEHEDQETFQFEMNQASQEETSKKNTDALNAEPSKLENREIHEEDRWKNKKSQTLEEFFEDQSEAKETVKTNIVEQEESMQKPTTKDIETEDIVNDHEEHINEDESTEQEETEKINFLAKLFRENSDENDDEGKYSQMRICIVQENDTLEKIAEKYEIPKLRLLKQNSLEDDQLVEGQLLSIPVGNKKK